MNDIVHHSPQSGILNWVNSTKGIGVVLVVLVHMLHDSSMIWLDQLIHSFIIPLFFILSGYVQKEYIGKNFIKNRAKRILIPYLAFTIIGMPYFGFFKKSSNGLSWFDILIDAFYVKGLVANNPLWFLAVLFEVSVIIAVLKLPQRNVKIQCAAYVVSLVAGFAVYSMNSLSFLNLFGINRAIVCLSFYIFGMLLRKIPETVLSNMAAIVFMTINVIFGLVWNSKVSIYKFDLGLFVPFQIASIGGSISVMAICRVWFDKECYLTRLSKYTILMLGSQYFMILPFRKIMKTLGKSGSFYYDIAMVFMTCIYLILVPILYEWLKKKVNMVKYFNGELV